MAGPHAIRTLLVDDEPSLIDDYRHILGPPGETRDERLFDRLESDLFGSTVQHKRFPEIDLVAFHQGREAVEAVRAAIDEGRPFTVAFIDLYLAPGLDGLQTATQIRALDPDIHIVLVSAHSNIHPVDMSERVPPTDQLYFVKKPFHAVEIQQLVLALSARWRGERWHFGGGRPAMGPAGLGRGGLSDVLERLPAGAIVFDRRDRLLSANQEMGELLPELADLFVSGTPYEEIQRGIAERLLPENTLVRVDTWVSERLEWHARSGGALEQRLRGSRWVLLVEGTAPSGETFNLYYDITGLKRREASRATAAHMTHMAQSFAALCEQFDGLSGKAGRVGGAAAASRGVGSAITVLPGAIGGPTGLDQIQSLADKLQAIAQRQRLAPEAIGLNRVVGETVRKMRAELPPAVQMEVIAGAGLWPVLLDGAKFEIVLAELVRNACEAMGNGGRLTLETVNIRLTRDFVATRAGLLAGEYVRLSIQDSGQGMSPELAERALNPFFTSKDKSAHMGLGLSMVYGFINQSGGYIEIDGGEGRGATIDLYFPRGEEHSAKPIEDETLDGLPIAGGTGSEGKRRA
jgi:signal transduction histidine kinase